MKMKRFFIGILFIAVTGLVLGSILFLASPHSSVSDSISKRDPADEAVDLIVVNKSLHRLSLYWHGRPLREYDVALGRNPGQKMQKGDGKTPEGKYKIAAKVQNSKFHFALLLSYPNDDDIKRAHEAGVDPGSEIEIHGLQNGLGWIGSIHKYVDWTDGCIGMTDEEVDEVASLVNVGTDVMIYP